MTSPEVVVQHKSIQILFNSCVDLLSKGHTVEFVQDGLVQSFDIVIRPGTSNLRELLGDVVSGTGSLELMLSVWPVWGEFLLIGKTFLLNCLPLSCSTH